MINNETNMINEIIHKVSVIDNDTLYLIDDKLDKIIKQTKIKIKIKTKTNTTPKAKFNTISKTKNKDNTTLDKINNLKS